MPRSDEMISINVTIDVSVSTLETIVENAKNNAGADEKGIYRVDTAEQVNSLVSGFLQKFDFDGYVNDINNYNC